MNKGTAKAMGIKSSAADMVMSFSIALKTVVSAALGVVNIVASARHATSARRRCGRKNAVRNQELDVRKI